MKNQVSERFGKKSVCLSPGLWRSCSWGCPGCSVLGRTHRKAGPRGGGWPAAPAAPCGVNLPEVHQASTEATVLMFGLEMEFQEFGEEMVGKNMSMDIFFVRFFVRKQKRQVGSML